MPRMATLDEVKEHFRNINRPSVLGVSQLWESPYRLLGGALYSIRRGIKSKGSARDVPLPKPLPDNWIDILLRHTAHGITVGKDERWVHIWAASYMFTNAVYRIASATEKVVGLAAGKPGKGRDVIGAFKDAKKGTPKGLEKARQFLTELPRSDKHATDKVLKERTKLLEGARANFPKPFPALVCAIIQTDSDKHEPEHPRKELEFDCALATNSFLEACTVFDQAVSQAPRN